MRDATKKPGNYFKQKDLRGGFPQRKENSHSMQKGVIPTSGILEQGKIQRPEKRRIEPELPRWVGFH